MRAKHDAPTSANLAKKPGARPWQLPTDRLPTESEEQMDFVRWFRRAYPGVRIFAIPNGDLRSKSQGARLKAQGVSAGVPDLYVPEWSMWIEMKRTAGGRVDPEQTDWHEYLRRRCAMTVLVAKGSLEAQRMVTEFSTSVLGTEVAE